MLNYTTVGPKQLQKSHKPLDNNTSSTRLKRRTQAKRQKDTKGNKLGDKTRHSIPDGRQDGRQAQGGGDSFPDRRQAGRQAQGGGPSIPDQLGDKMGDKTEEVDTASHSSWKTRLETRPETRKRQAQKGGHQTRWTH